MSAPRPSDVDGADHPVSGEGLVYRPPAVSARPPVELDNGLIGFARLTRGRNGSRVFVLFFVVLYLLILVQTLSTIL